jgi:hypothetical protein
MGRDQVSPEAITALYAIASKRLEKARSRRSVNGSLAEETGAASWAAAAMTVKANLAGMQGDLFRSRMPR